MSGLWRLLQLSPRDRQNLLVAGATVLAVRLALWILPFEQVRRIYSGAVTPPRHGSSLGSSGSGVAPAVAEVAAAVRRASRLVPGASCLTQALATRELLARRGVDSRLRIGVAKKGDALEAHAWVEKDSQVVIGRVPRMERFAVLPDSALNAGFAARLD